MGNKNTRLQTKNKESKKYVASKQGKKSVTLPSRGSAASTKEKDRPSRSVSLAAISATTCGPCSVDQRSRSRHGNQNVEEQLKEIKAMLRQLSLNGQIPDKTEAEQQCECADEEEFPADFCRKCNQLLCLSCRMNLESCCCRTPNFLICQDCDMAANSCKSNRGVPMSCQKCDQKLCLVCRQYITACICPKPNFLICRGCEIRIKTRCCVSNQLF